MYPRVILLSTVMAIVTSKSILMTEVFIIPIRPEIFDWSADGKLIYSDSPNSSQFSEVFYYIYIITAL